MSLRVGTAMMAVLRHVRDNPGCSMGQAAEAVKSNRRNGYDAAHRCWQHGLISVTQTGAGYQLWLSNLGSSLLNDATGRR